MSFTRYHDDTARIKKQVQIDTYAGRYALMTPMLSHTYIEDPHIRLNTVAGNQRTNTIGVESDLRGLTRRLTHDNINRNDYQKNAVYSSPIEVQSATAPYVDESRATLPAFLFREAVMYRWEKPFLDPQKNLELPFNWNLQTRILEKDYWQGIQSPP
jgi:hypothetical protein